MEQERGGYEKKAKRLSVLQNPHQAGKERGLVSSPPYILIAACDSELKLIYSAADLYPGSNIDDKGLLPRLWRIVFKDMIHGCRKRGVK
jgi:hypothetical protein